jgi:hypothetical protein
MDGNRRNNPSLEEDGFHVFWDRCLHAPMLSFTVLRGSTVQLGDISGKEALGEEIPPLILIWHSAKKYGATELREGFEMGPFSPDLRPNGFLNDLIAKIGD